MGFEQVAASSLDNTLTKFSAKEYILNAFLCHLATGEVVAARRAHERFLDLDITYSGQREAQFSEGILKAFEDGDVEEFTQAVIDFDRVSKLSALRTTLLLRIKKHIGGEGGAGGAGDDDDDIL
eukprot:Amastigsp_a841326_220.p2 type:complete len:124 gc:universal Amastigsp_a841326_220:1-372(+)